MFVIAETECASIRGVPSVPRDLLGFASPTAVVAAVPFRVVTREPATNSFVRHTAEERDANSMAATSRLSEVPASVRHMGVAAGVPSRAATSLLNHPRNSVSSTVVARNVRLLAAKKYRVGVLSSVLP